MLGSNIFGVGATILVLFGYKKSTPNLDTIRTLENSAKINVLDDSNYHSVSLRTSYSNTNKLYTKMVNAVYTLLTFLICLVANCCLKMSKIPLCLHCYVFRVHFV